MAIIATPSATDANSYLSDAAFLSYASGSLAASVVTASTADTRERALRTATRMIDRCVFVGLVTVPAQSLEWPRYTVVDPDRPGYLLATNAIPRRVQEACAELALALLAAGEQSPDGALPDAAQYKRARVDVIEVEYRDGAAASDPVGILARYPAVMGLLSPLLENACSMEAVRA